MYTNFPRPVLRPKDYVEDQDVMELVPNIILNPGFMEMDPIRAREPLASSIIRSAECPGPGKPRRVWFSSILNLRILYRTDSGLLSWSRASHDRTVVVDKSVQVWTTCNDELNVRNSAPQKLAVDWQWRGHFY